MMFGWKHIESTHQKISKKKKSPSGGRENVMTKEKGVPKTRGIEGSQKGEHKLMRKKWERSKENALMRNEREEES